MKIKKISLIIIALLLVVAYTTLLTNYNKEQTKKNKKPVKQTTAEIVTLDKVTNYINANKLDYLDILNITFTNEKEVSNQAKLKLAYYTTGEESNYDQGVGYTKINSYIYRVFGENTKIVNEDILTNKEVSIKFDNTNDIYIKINDNIKMKEIHVPTHKYIISYEAKESVQVLEINKFYERNNKVYSSYGNMMNEVDDLFTIPENEDKESYIKKYTDNNYAELKNSGKLDVYKYTFIKEKSTLILKSYEISK